jgi:hypothetical protein
MLSEAAAEYGLPVEKLQSIIIYVSFLSFYNIYL